MTNLSKKKRAVLHGVKFEVRAGTSNTEIKLNRKDSCVIIMNKQIKRVFTLSGLYIWL